MRSQKKKSGTKKHGRNKVKCAVYEAHKKREKSHIRRIEKHMKRYGDDSPMAQKALNEYREKL